MCQEFSILFRFCCCCPSVHGISQQEYWSGLPFPPPGLFLTQGLNLSLLQWQADSLPPSHQIPGIYLNTLHGSSLLAWEVVLQKMKLKVPTFFFLFTINIKQASNNNSNNNNNCKSLDIIWKWLHRDTLVSCHM